MLCCVAPTCLSRILFYITEGEDELNVRNIHVAQNPQMIMRRHVHYAYSKVQEGMGKFDPRGMKGS